MRYGAALAATAGLAAGQSGRPAPNFVVLFADDLGYGDLACYGSPTNRTPNLDRMAEEGTRFTSFYTRHLSAHPRALGFDGRYPVRAGQPGNTGPDTMDGLPLGEILLSQVLK